MKVTSSRMPEGVERFDHHGFAVFHDNTMYDCERHHPTVLDNELVTSLENMEAWQVILSDWSWTQINGCRRLRSLIKKGVPPSLRQQLWLNLLGCKHLKQSSKFNYKASVKLIRRELVDIGISEYCLKEGLLEWTSVLESQTDHPVPPQVIRQITVDIDRSFPTHRLFMEGSCEAKEGRASLFRLLAVYAFYNPDVGYCQGMSYIAGMLLMQMTDEEEAFWALVSLFEKPKYLSGYFDQSLLRIQQHAAVFQKLITHRLPKFAKHLESIELHLLTFVTPWFMCLYTSFPCWDTVLTIWDLILLDGISTIFRVALAVLSVNQDELLQTSDMSHILPQLLHPSPQLVSAENLLPVVWKTTVDKWEIDALHAIVAEESDPKPGRKRRRHIDSDADDSEQAGKRPRGAESGDGETSVFQRVLGLFKSSSRQTRRGASKSHTARTRASNRANQVRPKTPGVAKASMLPRSMAPGIAKTATLPHNTEISFSQSKAPGLKMSMDLNLASIMDEGNAVPQSIQTSSTKIKAPDSRQMTSPLKRNTASVKWNKIYESPTCLSPWKDGLRALTFTLPVHDGITLGTEHAQINSAVTEQSASENCIVNPNKPNSGLMCKLKASVGYPDINFNSLEASSTGTTNLKKQECEEDRISPCLIATENSLNNKKTQDMSIAQSSRQSSVKAVRFSPRFSEDRVIITSKNNIKPLNTPSGRRIISNDGSEKSKQTNRLFSEPSLLPRRDYYMVYQKEINYKSAKVMHSFKTFHTPTPLRRSQVSRLDSSPYFSSPEVELQPMKLTAHMKKDNQE